MTTKKIAIVPQVHGLGGMVSFRGRFIKGLEQRGIETTANPLEEGVESCLVIGGTKKIGMLKKAKSNGVKIIQRLNGMNWVHMLIKTPFNKKMRAGLSNYLLAFIRKQIAQGIIYQSQFSLDWWDEKFGEFSKPHLIVYNAVPLDVYQPDQSYSRPDHCRILVLEGNMSDYYAGGLTSAYKLCQKIAAYSGSMLELQVAGDVPASTREMIKTNNKVVVSYLGVVAAEQVPSVLQQAHMLFSADVNAACPNSVVEALACGLPVAAYDTGALLEMVPPTAGAVAPYGSDPWKLEEPIPDALAEACIKIWRENSIYRQGARARAEEAFGLDRMINGYLRLLG